MKKILLTSIALAGFGVSAFGQGSILFANNDVSSGFVTINSTAGAKTTSGLVVELFWNNGSQYVLQDTFTSTYTGVTSGGQSAGTFNAGSVAIAASGAQSFYIEGFYTTGGNAYSGVTADFTAPVNASPAPPAATDEGGTWITGSPGEQGALVLHIVPEPSTIALGGLGAAVLLLFRRKK